MSWSKVSCTVFRYTVVVTAAAVLHHRCLGWRATLAIIGQRPVSDNRISMQKWTAVWNAAEYKSTSSPIQKSRLHQETVTHLYINFDLSIDISVFFVIDVENMKYDIFVFGLK